MNKYFIFAGDNYYPLRGWRDFKTSFSYYEEAEKYVNDYLEGYDWV